MRSFDHPFTNNHQAAEDWHISSDTVDTFANNALTIHSGAQGFFVDSGEDAKVFVQADNGALTMTSGANLFVTSNDDIRSDLGLFKYTVNGKDAQSRTVWVTTDHFNSGISMEAGQILDIDTARDITFEVNDFDNNGHDLLQTFGGDMYAYLQAAGLLEADLQGANLREADLRGAYFLEADLRGASLRHARLHDADLQGANLQKANLQDAYLVDANLQRANLESAFLVDINLFGANLRGANLQSTVLRGANLREADLQGANLKETDLRYASRKNTILSSRDDLIAAKYSSLNGFVFIDEERFQAEKKERENRSEKLFSGKETGDMVLRVPDTVTPSQLGILLLLITPLYEGVRMALTAPFHSIKLLRAFCFL